MTDLSKVKIRFTNADGTPNEFEATYTYLGLPPEMSLELKEWETTGGYQCIDTDPSGNSCGFNPSICVGYRREWWLHVDDCIVE